MKGAKVCSGGVEFVTNKPLANECAASPSDPPLAHHTCFQSTRMVTGEKKTQHHPLVFLNNGDKNNRKDVATLSLAPLTPHTHELQSSKT